MHMKTNVRGQIPSIRCRMSVSENRLLLALGLDAFFGGSILLLTSGGLHPTGRCYICFTS